MANYVKGARGSKLLVKFGDGGSPEVFTAPCSINAERAFALEANLNEDVSIDCDNPEAPGWIERTVESLSGQVEGAGRLNTTDWRMLRRRMVAGLPVNLQIVMDVPLEDGGEVASGAFVMSKLAKTGTRGGQVQFSVTLQSTGPLEFEDIDGGGPVDVPFWTPAPGLLGVAA